MLQSCKGIIAASVCENFVSVCVRERSLGPKGHTLENRKDFFDRLFGPLAESSFIIYLSLSYQSERVCTHCSNNKNRSAMNFKW